MIEWVIAIQCTAFDILVIHVRIVRSDQRMLTAGRRRIEFDVRVLIFALGLIKVGIITIQKRRYVFDVVGTGRKKTYLV